MNFAPLHIYSGYTFLNSGLTINKIIKNVVKNDYSYCGISDRNTITGVPEFFHLMEKQNKTPVLGMDVVSKLFTFTLIVKNESGYRNLLKIINTFQGQNSEIDLNFLVENQEGLFVIIHSSSIGFKDHYLQNYFDFCKKLANFSLKFTDFYIGLEVDEPGYMRGIREFASSHNYKIVAFPFIQYEKSEDAITLQIVNAIANEEKLEATEAHGQNYFLNQDELEHFYFESELLESETIAKTCDFKLVVKRGELPLFIQDSGLSSENYLRKLAFEGLKEKIGEIDKIHEERLNYELNVISSMGYNDYFLIVRDYVNFAKNSGISVGPGRGSAAGSLVSYALGIVAVDPIKFDLMFERFLNPERQSMPDIDIDFSDIRREEVVSYLESKYGKERVSRIITMQTIGAKQSIRDVGRVFEISDSTVELLSKSIVNANLSLRENYKTNKAFRDLVDSDKYYLNTVALAAKIEGLPRQSGLHAAGVILNSKPVSTCVPAINQAVGSVCLYEKDFLEEQGMLKMDILALRNLTVIDNILTMLRINKGINLKYDDIPFNNQKALTLIGTGKTIGLFQLESTGMKKAIQEVKVDTFDDIIAIISLFRPGPMQNIPSYARRKAGKEKIIYISPLLEPILKNTFGIIVYQEQIMQIVQKVAGFTFGQSDSFRRAISKKDSTKLASLKDSFINGAIKNNVNRREAENIFNLIFKFASYGFNKSHALSYAVIASQMAYLKAHYPAEFYACILESTRGSNDVKFAETISEIRSIGIKLMTPTINECEIYYTVNNSSLICALSSIKSINENDAATIINERNTNGLFKDFNDFVIRCYPLGIEENKIHYLIDAGCFDLLNPSRASLRANVLPLVHYVDMIKDFEQSLLNDDSLFPKPKYISVNDDKTDNINREFVALGAYITSSPLFKYENYLATHEHISIAEAQEEKNEFTLIGIISFVKKITTKAKKEPMAFIRVYDETGEIEATMFPTLYAQKGINVKENKVCQITGKIDFNRDKTFIIDSFDLIPEDNIHE